jgi:hypothetical protein
MASGWLDAGRFGWLGAAAYGVDAAFMQLQQRGWDIHAV